MDANDARAARAARKAATKALAALTSCEETLGAAELVIGELLSNAARHADGFVCLELSQDEGHAQISVHDTSPAFALDISRPPDEYSESGRGLFIISELARKVTVSPLTGVGKRVMVTLDIPVAGPDGVQPLCRRPWLHNDKGICLRPRMARLNPSLIGEPES